MSYEGYTQNICKAGHLFYGSCDGSICHCGQEAAWTNHVDDTNGDQWGHIGDFSLLLLDPEVTEKCNLGHTHRVKEAVYRLPSVSEYKWLIYRSSK